MSNRTFAAIVFAGTILIGSAINWWANVQQHGRLELGTPTFVVVDMRGSQPTAPPEQVIVTKLVPMIQLPEEHVVVKAATRHRTNRAWKKPDMTIDADPSEFHIAEAVTAQPEIVESLTHPYYLCGRVWTLNPTSTDCSGPHMLTTAAFEKMMAERDLVAYQHALYAARASRVIDRDREDILTIKSRIPAEATRTVPTQDTVVHK